MYFWGIMAYSEKQIKDTFNEIILDIENGMSLRASLRKQNRPDSTTFYKWIDNDKEKNIQYARACEIRADKIFEEIIEISDHSEEDHTPFTGGNVIRRDQLKIDARKWMLGKMNPKKYGDKIQQEHSGGVTQTIISLGTGINPNETNN